jgi:hypothetical protein
VEQVKIHSGTRVKLKRVAEGALPVDFLGRLHDHAQKDERILAIFIFLVQPEAQPEQPSMAVAIKTGVFEKADDVFLRLVDEIQPLLPEDMALNMYRYGASELLTKYCASSVEPVFLRSASWLDKQRKRLA